MLEKPWGKIQQEYFFVIFIQLWFISRKPVSNLSFSGLVHRDRENKTVHMLGIKIMHTFSIF